MRNLLAVFLLTVAIPAICIGQSQSAYRQAELLLKEKDFFRAQDFYKIHAHKMTPGEKLVLEAYIGNAFNRPARSNTAIAAFLKDYAVNAKDSLKLELLRLKQSNHVRLFEYADALAVSNEIFKKYSSLLSSEENADYKNTAIIWKALRDSPKQEIEIAATTIVRMTRDKANLANLKITANSTEADFIFDTGANFSTVTESTAKSFNMKMLDGAIKVGSITGAKVNSRLAVCPKLSIGNITVKNAVFLVFPDSALAFPQIQYQINGIIGFPVIEGLKEVQITRNDEFIVPKRRLSANIQNLALDFLTPVLNLDGEYFTFDTGATGTMLYSKYVRKHEAEIKSQYTLTDLEFGGAGGMLKKKGYKITYSPVINGKKLNLEDVQVLRESLDENKDHFYGNIGQDVIKQFDKMILNFSSMFIRFEWYGNSLIIKRCSKAPPRYCLA